MTATLNGPANGKAQRKSLAEQLDRFDRMLDGLDQGLQGAIADAVREAVAAAVAEGVRAALLELATNPDLLAVIRGSVVLATPAAPAAPADAGPRPTLSQRIRRGLETARNMAVTKVKNLGRGIADAWRSARGLWRLKWPLAIAAGVGVVAGAAAYASAPWLAGVIGGLGATGTALGAQLLARLRRFFSRLPAGC